ncbi:hypothetical protein M413DRAFT_446755 [Hebeloma cylindrosporum]|uniref:DH domain-containing protein n=1 Tax=Hebeloma cylindrosporum TaxID=76867 RepID=A0A0C3C8C2_HEBCY|nr:hypothetical protein M413DRAFT_446755 [Hebeloma cylindrosporum h7]
MYGNRRTSASAVPTLPPGAQQPAVAPTNSASPADNFQITPPIYQDGHHLQNPWSPNLLAQNFGRPRVQSMNSLRPSSPDFQRPRISFPEPDYHPSFQQQHVRPTHQYSRSDLGGSTSHLTAGTTPPWHPNPSVASFASSYVTDDHNYGSGSNEAYDDDARDLVRGLSDLSISSEEALRHFQAGELPEKDQEWHRLVPPEARDALGKKEVQRQSVIFEVIKSEREYVADLEAVEHVFIEGLRTAAPPIIREPRLSEYINEVFGNLRDIVSHHQRILAALFARQRDQHPLIQSVADIILDTTLKSDFRSAYETYIKHYPLAESLHRNQLKTNRAYEAFILSVSTDPRIRKRDLITFLSRPVTKLPRLNLLLEQILKLTDKEHDHPDIETLPIILGILKDCIKSTQPGIEAAESKVKFWALCESLVFQKGEIIDMDLYDDSRTLVYSGPTLRKARTETGFSERWTDLVAALLDNYFLLAREEKRPNGSVRRLLMSRPMPLSFLRLGSFDGPPESRREKADDGRLLESWRSQSVPVYPFTIYHASSRAARRYTLYVTSDAVRKKWYNAFVDAIGVHKVRQDANMWFNPQTITDGFFRTTRGASSPPIYKITGQIKCAVPFSYMSRRFLAVGCGPGIYVGPTNTENFRWVLNYKNPTSLATLTSLGDKVFNRFVIHSDSSLVSYSLDILSRLALGQSQTETLDASIERISGNDVNVAFCKHVHLGGRSLLIFSSKRRLGSSLNLQVLEAVDSSEIGLTPRRSVATGMRSFRPYGETGYIPKDAHDIVALAKMIGICTNDGIVTLDPTNLARSAIIVVPVLNASGNNESMAYLKARLEGLRPLGFVSVNPSEFLVIYDEVGCYIDKRGVPTRESRYIKWETKAVSYAARNGHILLVSPEFIEIRNITTGRLVQVIEGKDMRLIYSGPYTDKEHPILVAMRGGKDDPGSVSERVVEMIETEEISLVTPSAEQAPSIWDEWDM